MERRVAPRLRAGLIRRAHGVRGEVRVLALGGDAGRFHPGLRLTREPAHGGTTGEQLTLTGARALDDGDVLARFAEVTTREAAEALTGSYLCVERGQARPLEENEWFVGELVGLRAVTPEGDELGAVADVEGHPGQDTLLVAGRDGERRFPLARAFVQRVDVPAGIIVITPWEEA